jgi:hypothetical protein
MLTIQNTDKLIGQRIDTTTAQWEVMNVEVRKNDYRIQMKFNFGKVHGMKHPKYVQFILLRYNQYQNLPNEWLMMNNWKPDRVTLTKGLLNLKVFVGILGGVLDNS